MERSHLQTIIHLSEHLLGLVQRNSSILSVDVYPKHPFLPPRTPVTVLVLGSQFPSLAEALGQPFSIIPEPGGSDRLAAFVRVGEVGFISVLKPDEAHQLRTHPLFKQEAAASVWADSGS